ncbi:hypothetical protein [Mycobacterium sp.]|uniref:hypothetical protein n=1 Tax=Mycobacterium sp. TaxID=1785 RepID=UPI003D0A864D
MTISYTRTFAHTDWVDNVDRVQAGGDNGFNGRFHSVEAEFDVVSGVFNQVGTQLGTLEQQVSALGTGIARTVSIAPVLAAAGPTGWDTSSPGVARKPSTATSAHGAVAVALPAGAQITAFRALGNNAGTGSILLDLMGQGLDGQGQAPVVRITINAQQAPFDITKNPVGGSGRDFIDPDSSYFILARLDNAGAADNVFLTGFQVLYQAR